MACPIAGQPILPDEEQGPLIGGRGPEDEPRPTRFSTVVDAGKKYWGRFKSAPMGILLLQRWLPLQDVSSDCLVTWCVEGFPLCSNQGVWWTHDYWWAHLSASFIALPYILLWLLSTPLVRRALRNRGWSDTFIFVTWFLIGLPCTVLMDFFLLLCFPMWHPTASWLLNWGRLRTVLETLVESPTQLVLQIRIAFFKWWYRSAAFPWTLLLSIATSVVSIGLTLLDIKADADAVGISVFEQLKDQFLVGLGSKAPLLNVLRSMPSADYSAEDELSDEHTETILKVAATCSGLKKLTFSKENDIADRHLVPLLKLGKKMELFVGREKHAVPAAWDDWIVFDKDASDLKLDLGCSQLTEAEAASAAEELGTTLDLTSLTLHLSTVSWSLGEAGVGSMVQALGKLTQLTCLKLSLHGDVRGVSLAEAIGKLQALTTLHLHVSYNALDDSGCRRVAEAVGKLQALTSLHLGLGRCDLRVAGCRSVVKVVGTLQSLTSLGLDIYGNDRLGWAGKRSVVEGLTTLQGLTSLDLNLSYTNLGNAGARSVADTIGKLQNLSSLAVDLSINPSIGEGAKEAVRAAARSLPKLAPEATELRFNERLY